MYAVRLPATSNADSKHGTTSHCSRMPSSKADRPMLSVANDTCHKASHNDAGVSPETQTRKHHTSQTVKFPLRKRLTQTAASQSRNNPILRLRANPCTPLHPICQAPRNRSECRCAASEALAEKGPFMSRILVWGLNAKVPQRSNTEPRTLEGLRELEGSCRLGCS